MNLRPAVRTVLTIVATAVAAVGSLLASGSIADVPEWVGVAVTVVGTIFAGIGIVPFQVGGTQKGVVNPTIKDLPPSPNIEAGGEAGYGRVQPVLVLLLVVLTFLAILALTGKVLLALFALVLFLLLAL